jgi:hypothetical protein
MAARRSAQCHKRTLRHEAAYKMWMAPMGGSGPSQPRWRGMGSGRVRHPARYCARYARATKSVIDLKVDAELSRFRSGKSQGIPWRRRFAFSGIQELLCHGPQAHREHPATAP